MSEVSTKGKGCGYWPTPTIGDVWNSEGSIKQGVEKHHLNAFVKMWPTPQFRDFRTGESKRWDNPDRSRNLNDCIVKYPTPCTSDYKGIGPLGSKSHNHNLDRKHLDATIQDKEQQTGQLNPRWVEWLMGWPIGWTSLEPLQGLVWPDWSHDPADDKDTEVPRLATSVPDRVASLKGIGNGQVPLSMVTAWEILTNQEAENEINDV